MEHLGTQAVARGERLARRRWYKRAFGFALLVVVLVAIVILTIRIPPTVLVETIGVQNGYLLAFLVSLFGGFSAAGSVSFISTLLALTAGGLNPVYLGIISGVSLALGDTFMFFIARKGRALIEGKWHERIERFAQLVQKKIWSRRLIPVIAYVYIGFSPLPNDMLIAALAAIQYPPKRTHLLIIAGDVTFALVITLVVAQGTSVFL